MAYHSSSQMIDPYLLFDKAQLREGMHIADFGCGRSGHLVFPSANAVGEHGMVYAVDIMKDVLESIRKQAKLTNALHIHTVWADVEREYGVAIPPKSLDIVFLVNTLVQTEHKEAVLQETERLLKNKARVVIVDWKKKGLSFGPRDETYIDFDKIKSWARKHNFVIQEEFPMGTYHYGLILYKHD